MKIVKPFKIGEKLDYQEKQNLPDSAFAAVYKDPETGEKVRKYPVHDAEHVRNAIARFSQFKQELPPGVRAQAARKIYEAAKRFGVEVNDEDILRYVGKSSEKEADKVTYQERQKMPDSAFALVYKDPKTGKKVREYLVHDEAHVRNAIVRFSQFKHKIPPEYRAQVAKKIYSRAKHFGIEVNDEDILRYVGKTSESKAAEYIDFLMKHPKIRENNSWVLALKLAQKKLAEGDTDFALQAAQNIEISAGLWDSAVLRAKFGPDIYFYSGMPKYAEEPLRNIDIDGMMVGMDEIKKAIQNFSLLGDRADGFLISQIKNALERPTTAEEMQDAINDLSPDVREALKKLIADIRLQENPIEIKQK